MSASTPSLSGIRTNSLVRDGCIHRPKQACPQQKGKGNSNTKKRVLTALNIYAVRHVKDAHYGAGIHRGEDMYEVGGFIVHFFSRGKVQHLAKGCEIVGIDEFEEGELPRRLFRVTLRKKEVQ